MPSGLSSYGSQFWLGAVFGVNDTALTYWLALCNSEPGSDMDGDIVADLEPDAASYARVSYSANPDNWYADSGYISNVFDINFPLPQEDWGYVDHFALLSAQTSGELYAWGEFLNPQFITSDFGMVIPAGGVVVTMSSLDNSIAP